MSADEWNSMVSAFVLYYGPMLAMWRVVYLACATILGILIFAFLMIQRFIQLYL
jgi:hypothetical protein